MKKLPREFYRKSSLALAPELLGKILIRRTAEGITAGRIVEAEAYLGTADAASHTRGGKRTGRTEILYGPGGHAYVYLIYGLHHCLNIVANDDGVPEGVMVRALEPLEGLDLMTQRCGGKAEKELCNGPGRLCAALGIDKSCYGLDLCGDELFLMDDGVSFGAGEIAAVPRIGVDYAGEDALRPWRFLVKTSPFLSVKPKEVKK